MLLTVAYVAMAYVVLPAAWTHYEHQPALAGRSMVTQTAQGIPGDPLNVGLVGDRADIIRAMHAAGWYPADAITLRTSAEIVGSVLLDRPYRDAPVSNLFYDGRKEDLAFEKPEGASADRRHHVRYWRVLESGAEGRPVWLGSATYDRGVGLSRYTGQVTHHIASDVDADRDLLISDLTSARMVASVYQVTGVGLDFAGRNGGGDPYRTDGEIWIARLVGDGQQRAEPPAALPAPVLVQAKDAVSKYVNRALAN
jgi:hypothetical protein